MNVKIKIYNFELESMLDRIQQWGHQYDWGGVSGHPNFQIELVIEKDLEGVEQKYIGDRFAEPQTETTNSEKIMDLIKNAQRGPSLSEFVKGGK